MRLHIKKEALALLRLAETPPALRRAVEGLKVNPYPEWSYEVPDRPGRREFFESGHWVVYEVEKVAGETIVRVILIEVNE